MARPYVLMVEDNAADAHVVQAALEDAGIDVEFEHVLDGETGLVALAGALRREQRPASALVLLDLGLPGMDGIEVLRRFKQFPATKCIPVIVLSGSQNPKAVKHALERHANAYLRKQADLDAFAAAICSLATAFLRDAATPLGAWD